MPRWLKVVRGMIGTGVTFAAGVGVVSALVGLVALLVGELTGLELLQVVGKFSIVAFLLGLVTSGGLAIGLRGCSFDKLTIRRVAAIGAGGGLLYFLLIAINASKVWSMQNAVGNLVILVLMGSVSAAGTLMLARRAGRTFKSDSAPDLLSVGMTGKPLSVRVPEHEANR